jgi:hypothetical protein
MKKHALLTLALLAAPALAAASPEVAARQAPAPSPIVIHARSLLQTRIVLNEFRVVRVLPLRVTLESIGEPRVRFTVHVGFNTAVSLRPGELVYLKIVPVRP